MQFVIVAPTVDGDDVSGEIAIAVLVDVVEKALPPEKRLTKTNVTTFKKDSPLLPSGLFGPVVLQVKNGE